MAGAENESYGHRAEKFMSSCRHRRLITHDVFMKSDNCRVLSSLRAVRLFLAPKWPSALRAEQQRQGSYVPALDGLRGLAVLLVVLFHAAAPPFQGGFVGVDMFFVLSGYLITNLLLQEYQQQGRIDFGRFYLRRFLRLMPALLFMTATFALVASWQLEGEPLRQALGEIPWAVSYLANWARAWDLIPMFYLVHTWSLAIEEQFYLLWPVVLLWTARKGGAGWTLGLALVLALASWAWRIVLTLDGAAVTRLYNGLDTRADALMWGCALSAWIRHGLAWRNMRWLGLLSVGALLTLLLCACLLDLLSQSLYLGAGTGAAWLTAILILDLAKNPASLLRRIFECKPLVLLGVLSYGVYLWHYTVYMFLFRQGVDWTCIRTWGTAAALLLAFISWRWVERPCLQLKAKWGSSTGRTFSRSS